MIVTIDGPAGAGKSCAARQLAKRLGFLFLDTGAMYRAVTYAAMQTGVPLDDAAHLELVACDLPLQMTESQVLLAGQDVTQAIRTLEVTTATRYAADHPGVRAKLVELQRQIARPDALSSTTPSAAGTVTEGRDQGTVVFPDAEVKIFLTASPQVRAERRYHDLLQRGETVSFDEVLEKQQARDHRDANRKVGALIPAADAIEVYTDGLSPEEVVDRLDSLVQAKR